MNDLGLNIHKNINIPLDRSQNTNIWETSNIKSDCSRSTCQTCDLEHLDILTHIFVCSLGGGPRHPQTPPFEQLFKIQLPHV